MDGSGRNVVDVSSFFLFEASGDSEADSEVSLDTVYMDVGYYDDDDAQSCSYDSFEHEPIVEFGGSDDGDHMGYVNFDGYDDGDQEDEDDEDGEEVNKQDCDCDCDCDGDGDFLRTGSRACVDSARDLMNEMEKNKLFWEACLAS